MVESFVAGDQKLVLDQHFSFDLIAPCKTGIMHGVCWPQKETGEADAMSIKLCIQI